MADLSVARNDDAGDVAGNEGGGDARPQVNTELPLLRNSKRKAESSAKGKFLGFFVAIMFSFVVSVFSDAFLHCVFVVFLVCMLVLCCAASFTSVRVSDLMLAIVFLRVLLSIGCV